jgi:predicted HicB family RNase H-like nuclease
VEEKIKQLYLRMPESIHKEIRYEAAEDDLSLNSCALNLLQEALEARHASAPNPQQRLSKPQS